MRICIVVAAAENDVIGSDNQLPWRLPDDLKRFRALTRGHPVVMGRRTYDSIGRPLPERTNIVVSAQPTLRLAGCSVVRSIDEALAAAQPAQEVFVIGGAQIYRQILPRTDTIHLTRVHAQVAGTVRLPQLTPEHWREISREYHPADERHRYAFSFITLQRVAP